MSALLLMAALASAASEAPGTPRQWIGERGLALVTAASQVEVLRLAQGELEYPELERIYEEARH